MGGGERKKRGNDIMRKKGSKKKGRRKSRKGKKRDGERGGKET